MKKESIENVLRSCKKRVGIPFEYEWLYAYIF